MHTIHELSPDRRALEHLGVLAATIAGYIADAILKPAEVGGYERTPELDRRLEERCNVGRGWLLAVGVLPSTIATWLHHKVPLRSGMRGFYTLSRAAFESVRAAAKGPGLQRELLNLPSEEDAASPVREAQAPAAEVLARGDDLVGVAIVGRLISCALQDGRTPMSRVYPAASATPAPCFSLPVGVAPTRSAMAGSSPIPWRRSPGPPRAPPGGDRPGRCGVAPGTVLRARAPRLVRRTSVGGKPPRRRDEYSKIQEQPKETIMKTEFFDEMQRLLDPACASPDSPEGRAALEQAASLWREYVSNFHKGLAFAATVSDDERKAVAEIIAPYLQRCAEAITAQ